MLLLAVLSFGLLWIWPTVLAGKIGTKRGQEDAWLWGFILSWIGVAIVMSFPAPQSFEIKPLDDRRLFVTTCERCGEAAPKGGSQCATCLG